MTTIEVICNVDIEKTPYSFHAHAVPDGIEINPGDTVQIHGAPTQVLFGDKYVTVLSATVTRAGPLLQAWTAFTAMFELTELYEVGFLPKETP